MAYSGQVIGAAPATSTSASVLPTKAILILENWRWLLHSHRHITAGRVNFFISIHLLCKYFTLWYLNTKNMLSSIKNTTKRIYSYWFITLYSSVPEHISHWTVENKELNVEYWFITLCICADVILGALLSWEGETINNKVSDGLTTSLTLLNDWCNVYLILSIWHDAAWLLLMSSRNTP